MLIRFKKLFPEIVEELEWRAKDNAAGTRGELARYFLYQDSVMSILESFQDEREWGNYTTLEKLGRPLTRLEAKKVLGRCYGFTRIGTRVKP